MNRKRIFFTLILAVVLLAFVLMTTAAVSARRAPTAEWICKGECQAFIEWSGKEPATFYILTNPPGCTAESNGDVGFIIQCGEVDR